MPPLFHKQLLHKKPIYHNALCCMMLLLLFVVVGSGCVRRRLTVLSQPVGALVYVDNQQIGTTPCSVDFTYYGTREIRLVKPGFETLTVNQPIPAPWYEYPPFDFFAENLAGRKIRDDRTVGYNLAPQIMVPTEELLSRGNELRMSTMQGTVIPAQAVVPVPSTVPPASSQPLFPPPNAGL